MQEVKPGKYQHFKGGFYEVLDVALHSETLEKLVVYRSLKDSRLYARPIEIFLGMVIVNGKEVSRFQYVDGC